MKFRNAYNTTPSAPVFIPGASLTIPEESLSIRQILQKSLTGIPPIYQEGIYADDPTFDDYVDPDFDLCDIDDYINENIDKIPHTVAAEPPLTPLMNERQHDPNEEKGA